MVLLDVRDLTAHYTTLRGPVRALEEVSFQIDKGEMLGIAGESGCGKTTVTLCLLRILPPGGKILGGKIMFKDRDILDLKSEEMRRIRWKEMSLVFQGAMNAFNPVYRVGDQIREAISTHEPRVSKREAKKRVDELFELVGIEPSRANNYPHEFSGGMKQRACIAMALSCNPDLLIADEPGTALDVIVQAQILRLLKNLREKLDLAMILISHDLSVISETCSRIAIMYAGRIVEQGDIVDIYKEPSHPYTQGLIAAFPSIKASKRRMTSIPGFPPDLLNPPSGCRFHPRCLHKMDVCTTCEPKLMKAGNRSVACHLVNDE